ncbi:Bbp16 family capsid cement protein [Amycolatopsis tolypomycina]|uniref:Bbp16 family capsid cement protein n=1 Tax=Amycolatopsis tolypomycina TaxID=208445 RepID=UPI00339F6031
MSLDLKNNVASAISLAPAARTATANGTGVDLAGFSAIAVVVAAGTITDGTHAFKVQESDDNATFTDVAAGDLDGAAPSLQAAGSNTVTEVGYKGIKRYIRVVATVSGTTTGGVYAALVVRGSARKYPK